jgi:hypothetical protein
LLWFDTSPDAGEPGCRCSWCNEGIETERDCVRMWYGDERRHELRFHALCFAWVAHVEGLLFEDVEAMCQHWRSHHV